MADSGIDSRLVAAYRAGDDGAFGKIYERYRAALVRYARRTLGGEDAQAEDVVQEAMFRASRALRRDAREMHLKPWLYRLVRNCALDELARVRTDSVELDGVEAAGVLRAAPATEPEAAHERRSDLRTVLGDVAALPSEQRHALLRRELDGVPMTQLATELGVSDQAAKSLVFRARTNLVKQRDARSATCGEVQRDLLAAHDGRRRGTAATYRHLAGCGDCRAFRSGLRTTRRSMALLNPGPLLLAGAGVGGTVKLLTGTASAAAPKAGAVVATAAVAVGAIGAVEVFRAGDPAPQPVQSIVLAGGDLEQGQPIPAGTAVVRQTVRLAAGSTEHPAITLPCPDGLRVADLLPAASAPVSATYAPETVPGVSTHASIVFEQRTVRRTATFRVGVLCKRPDARGSLLPGGRTAFAAGAQTAKITVRHALLRVAPGGAARGSVRLGQPVRLIGDPHGGWQRIVTDAGEPGWVSTSALEG